VEVWTHFIGIVDLLFPLELETRPDFLFAVFM
jgi:hypothetical protein